MTDNTNPHQRTPILYIVPTPIGNLGDITQRALQVLSEVDLIAAEDTRHTAKLLMHFNITTKTFALHDHNEQQKAQVLVNKLRSGMQIALVSDAGTPLISDPGYHLVSQCRAEGIRVVPLPGACAVITALSASGLPSDRFRFEGFLPAKSKARKDKFNEIADCPQTCIFYESPHRIVESLTQMQEVLGGDRQVALARELTKTFESIVLMPLSELLPWVLEDEYRQKGEMVLVVQGYSVAKESDLPEEALACLRVLAAHLPLKQASALTAEIHQLKKNALYKWGIAYLMENEKSDATK